MGGGWGAHAREIIIDGENILRGDDRGVDLRMGERWS